MNPGGIFELCAERGASSQPSIPFHRVAKQMMSERATRRTQSASWLGSPPPHSALALELDRALVSQPWQTKVLGATQALYALGCPETHSELFKGPFEHMSESWFCQKYLKILKNKVALICGICFAYKFPATILYNHTQVTRPGKRR